MHGPSEEPVGGGHSPGEHLSGPATSIHIALEVSHTLTFEPSYPGDYSTVIQVAGRYLQSHPELRVDRMEFEHGGVHNHVGLKLTVTDTQLLDAGKALADG